MRLQVKGKNLEVSDSIRRYAEEKLGKLNRQLHELTQVELELCVEKNPSIAQNQVAEATVWTKGPTLRAREASTDMKVSIDQLTDLVRAHDPRIVIGMESRGFIFAAPIAYQLNAGFVPVRKLGKLPGEGHLVVVHHLPEFS